MSLSIFESKKIEDRVEKIWERIFKNSNDVIKQSKVHGFLSIQEIPTPNIHEMLLQLKVLHVVMDMIITLGPENGLKYEQDIKFTKATRFENMVRFFESKEAKTINEKDLCS